jgi:lipopolysaccharide export system protein LptA
MRPTRVNPLLSHALCAALAVATACVAPGVRAEKADRNKPMTVDADSARYDDLKQVGTFTGNVVVTKGTIVMRAAQIEVRQSPEGYQYGVLIGGPGKPASFRQKRDGVDEFIEGEAERIEYDSRADTVRFVNRAVIRRYRGATLADETAGNLITYDNAAEVFSVSGSPSAATPANPGGRVRAVLTPRDNSAQTVPGAASAPALKPSGTLGEKR